LHNRGKFPTQICGYSIFVAFFFWKTEFQFDKTCAISFFTR
jgi:hypothetical protein